MLQSPSNSTQSLLCGRRATAPRSTRLCNILLCNRTVPHNRGPAISTHHKYILVIPSSLPLRSTKTIILQFLLCKGYIAALPKQDRSPSLCGLSSSRNSYLGNWLLYHKSSFNWNVRAQVVLKISV